VSTSTGGFFDKDPVNTGRQPELDLVKAFLILHLAPVHAVIETLPEEALAHGPAYYLDSVVGGMFGAPIFMFCMGVAMVYTRKRRPSQLAMRGISILLVGVILNIARYLIPFLIGYGITKDAKTFLEPLPYLFFANDILQLAGLSMLFMALLHAIAEKIPGESSRRVGAGAAILLLSLAMSAVGTAFIGTDMGNLAGNIAWGWLIGTEDAAGKVLSDFPMLQWFVFPAAGAFYGELLIRMRDKKRFYLLVSPVCAVLTVIGLVIGITGRRGMFGPGQMCFQHLTFPDALLALVGTVAVLGLWYAVSGILTDRVMGLVNRISASINASYCIHWVWVSAICMVAIPILGPEEPAFWPILLLGIGIAVISTAMGMRYMKVRDRRKKK